MHHSRTSLYYLKVAKPRTAVVVTPSVTVSPGTFTVDRFGAGRQATVDLSLSAVPAAAMTFTLSSSDSSIAVSPAVLNFGPGLPLTASLTLTGSTLGPNAVTVTATPSDNTFATQVINVTRPTLTVPATSNLAMWLRADTGLTKRGGGSVTALNDPIQGWQDLVTPSRTITQSTNAAQPVYNPSAVNGLPGVTFDGIAKLMTGPDSGLPMGNSDRTVLMVARWNQFVSSFGGVSYGSNSANATFGLVKYSGSPANATIQGWVTDYQSSFPIPLGNAFLWVVTLKNSGYLNQRMNRQLYHNVQTSLNTVSGNIRLGAETNTSGFQAITLCELMVYNRLLTDAEITQLETYAAMWGV